jgi:aspartate/methionine/tyrosine aminotransferase
MPINEVVRQYEEKRNVMVNALNKIPGISCVVPRGGFMAFPNVSKLGMSSLETCEFLLEKAKVATTPGIVFGRQGEGHLRFIYSSPIEDIEKGLDRVRIALEGISHKLETHAAV